MKILQAFLLGTVATMLVTGAGAAGERQVKAKPADQTNCSAYGPGFRYVPGADACVKVGGWVRTEAGAGNGAVNWGALKSGAGAGTTALGERGTLTTDVRKQTGYGTVRGYLSVGAGHE
jgi:hypothetical protein